MGQILVGQHLWYIKKVCYIKKIWAIDCSHIQTSDELRERIQCIECIEFQCIEAWTEHGKKASAFC